MSELTDRPQPLTAVEDAYRLEIEQAFHETRTAIDEALAYIERQEDGPVTMRGALREISARLDAVETEVCYLTGTLDWLQGIALELQTQRDALLGLGHE